MAARVVYRSFRKKGVFAYPEEVVAEISRTIDNEVKNDLIREFRKVVADWDSNVDFAARKFIRNQSLWLNVFATGEDKEVFGYVNRGTRPHTITAQNYVPRGQSSPRLVFEWAGPGTYSPRTRYRGIYGMRPGAYGPLWFFPSVRHPGNEGRDFSGKIGDEYQPNFERIILNAIRRGKRRARRF